MLEGHSGAPCVSLLRAASVGSLGGRAVQAGSCDRRGTPGQVCLVVYPHQRGLQHGQMHVQPAGQGAKAFRQDSPPTYLELTV